MAASPGSTALEHALDLGHGGDAERARHDGDMAGGTAFLQHQAAQALPVVIEQLGGAHGAGDQDGVLRQVAVAAVPTPPASRRNSRLERSSISCSRSREC